MLWQTTTHAVLLQKVAEGKDESAWREFCQRYGALIRSFARRRGLQPADCDEVLQEVLASLTNSMPGFRYDPSKGRFRSYLKTIALRVTTQRFFKKRGQVALQEIEEATKAAARDPDVEEVWEREWREHHLRRAMRVIDVEFNEADRAAFQSYAIDGVSAAETGAQLGMSAGQVYTAKSRILKRLSEVIAQQVEEEG